MSTDNHFRPSLGSNGNVAPFFAFGFERSGTTLLSMMLGAHPAIAVPFSVAGMWYRYYDRLDEYNDIQTTAGLDRLLRDILNDERISLWDVRFDRKTDFAGIRPGNYAAVIERIYAKYAEKTNKSTWGNVDILTLDRMDVANSWFPNARFLHIVRDGRDVALSHDTYAYGATNTLECAENWRFKLHANLKMGAMLNSGRYKVIRYEDLVLEPTATLRAICEFLKVEFSPVMLNYPELVKEKIPESRRSLWPLIQSRPQPDNAYRWRRHMNRTRRIVFERSATSTLRSLGYDSFDVIPKSAASIIFEFFCLMNRGHRFRRLARRFTFAKKATKSSGSSKKSY